MSGIGGVGGPVNAPAPRDNRETVRKLAHELEGVFLNQLFQAMRQSVPQGGAIDPAPGQEMFTQIFDERMANESSRRMEHGLGEALYRQLAARLPADGTKESE